MEIEKPLPILGTKEWFKEVFEPGMPGYKEFYDKLQNMNAYLDDISKEFLTVLFNMLLHDFISGTPPEDDIAAVIQGAYVLGAFNQQKGLHETRQ